MGKFEMESDEDVSIDEKEGVVYPPNYREKKMVSVNDIMIDTTQSRHGEWENDDLDLQLMSSVEEIGLIYDIMVRPTDSVKYSGEHDKPYACVAGSRRFHSMIAAGHTEVPCIVRDFSDIEAVEISLTENIGRKALSPFQEQRAVNLWYDMLLEKKIQETKELVQKNFSGFRTNHKKETINKTDKNIIKKIQENPTIFQSEIAESLSLSQQTISHHIKKLKKLGILEDYPYNIESSIKQEIAKKIYGNSIEKANEILRIGKLPSEIQILLKKISERTPEETEYIKSQGIKEDFIMNTEGFLAISSISKKIDIEKMDSVFSQKVFEMIKKGKIDKESDYKWQVYILKNIRDDLAKGKPFEAVMEELGKPSEREFIFEEGAQRYIVRVPPDYIKWHKRACNELRKKSNEIVSYIYLEWLKRKAKENDW